MAVRSKRFAMVCASNMNRSMEAHFQMLKQGFKGGSYGVGQHVKLPGPNAREPNVYDFGTPYRVIYEDLKKKDPELYTRNGLLVMLERNMKTKPAPERWQDNTAYYDVVVTFEERVFEQVIIDLQGRPQTTLQPVLVVNLDVKDSHEEAAIAAPLALQLMDMLEAAGEDWEGEVDNIVDRFMQTTGRRPLYTIWFGAFRGAQH